MGTPGIVRIYDEDEIGYDVCEVEPSTTRVLRVISSYRTTEPENREYQLQYQHACGYTD